MPLSKKCHLEVGQLRKLLSYDPLTGILTSNVRRGKWFPGQPVGTVTPYGYVNITVDGHSYRAHNLAWFLHHGEWPTVLLDHINRDKGDNRIANLRQADYFINNRNRAPLPNRFGLEGVRKSKRHKRYQSSLHVNGVRRHLGSFDTAEEAHQAFLAARRELEGEPARSSLGA
jgi:hypothetical protein